MADKKIPGGAAAAYIARAGQNAARAKPSLPVQAVVSGGALFNPKTSNNPAMNPTLSQLEDARRDVQEGGAAPTGLRPETIQGLQAMREASQAAQQPPPLHPTASPTPQPPPTASPAAPPPSPSAAETDAELEAMISGRRPSILNNERERKAIKERVKPIDLLQGIRDNVFLQHVPIVPGAFEVVFQSIPGEDSQAISLLLFKWVEEDKHKDEIWQQLLGLMQTTAMLKSVNGEQLPPHRKRIDGYDQFDEDAFRIKYRVVRGYPLPMLQALGSHAQWFDERVLECFSMDALKKS